MPFPQNLWYNHFGPEEIGADPDANDRAAPGKEGCEMGRSGAIHGNMLNKATNIFAEHWVLLFAIFAAAVLAYLIYCIVVERQAVRNLDQMGREAASAGPVPADPPAEVREGS